MKKIRISYIILSILILMMGIFIWKKYFAKNIPGNENSSFEKREIANIPFPHTEILSANRINRIDKSNSVPTTDLKGLNEYLKTLKGIKVTEKNIMMTDINYELNISGVLYRFNLADKKTDPYLYYDNVIWKIDLGKLDSFF